MTTPVTTLSFAPATPKAEVDGIVFTVTGEVRPTGKIVVMNTDDKIVASSPEFGQANRQGVVSEQINVHVTGAPAGGFFVLSAAGLAYPGDDPAVTAHIARNANVAAVQAALDLAWGTGETVVSGTSLALGLTVDFVGANEKRPITVTADASGLTGGTSPGVTITENTVGGATDLVPGGPYLWGPIVLFPDTDGSDYTYSADLLYASGDDAGSSMLNAALDLTVTGS